MGLDLKPHEIATSRCPDAYQSGDVSLPCRRKSCPVCGRETTDYWVGRMSAEAYHSGHAVMVTLTVADDFLQKIAIADHKATFKQYSQTLRMNLRRRGIEMKALGVVEYGTKKGRIHFHAILFLTGLPEWMTLEFATKLPCWPYGNSKYEKPRNTGAAMRYVYKYVTKDEGSQVFLSQGIGKEYLKTYAKVNARNGIEVFTENGLEYTVPNTSFSNGSLQRFKIPPRHHWISELACDYAEHFVRRYPDKELPKQVLQYADFG